MSAFVRCPSCKTPNLGHENYCFKCGSSLSEPPSGPVVRPPVATAKVIKTVDSETGRCPYCGTFLPKKPKRLTACKNCGTDIYVRSTQDLFPSGLLTSDQVAVLDLLKGLVETEWAISREDLLKSKETLRQQTGEEPTDSAAAWAIMKPKLEVRGFRSEDRGIYWLVGYFFLQLDKKEQAIHWYRKHREVDLRQLLGSARMVKIVCTHDCCSRCAKHKGQRFTIEEALRLMPVPCPTCRSWDDAYGCSCDYEAIWDEAL